MKNIYLFLLLLLTSVYSYAQIPSGYYDNANGKTGEELKTALHNIINGHTKYSYTASSTDVWDILKETDRDPNNPENVILIYSGRSVNGAQEYNNGSGWTREHVWAKSRGDFGTTQGPGTDVHHLRPCDVSMNSTRSNRWFAECNVEVYDEGVFTGSYKSDTEWTWEPRAEVKGDVARMIFYMATRYEGTDGEPDLELIDYLPTDDYTNEPIHALLSDLLAWHAEDPVDAWETNRNDIIYSKYQHNRNPFIDHPEYVSYIWGGSSVDPDPEPSTGYDSPITLTLVLDNYPSETTWNITDVSTGNYVTSGSGYTEQGATITKTVNLDAGDYTFNITDSYGDGICCTQGNGSYTLTDAAGTQIATGGDFTYSDQISFSIDSGSVDDGSSPTNPMPEGYCSSFGYSASGEWIDYVELGTIKNTSESDGGYADFTNMSTNLESGKSYIVSFSAGLPGRKYEEAWKIWIDFNRDGQFHETEEDIASVISSKSNTLTASFTVPSNISEGSTRMRVSMKYNSYASPCETFNYGEVEDYAVVLSAGKSLTSNTKPEEAFIVSEEISDLALFPNPVKDVLNIQLPEGMNAELEIYGISGQLIQKTQGSMLKRIDVSKLPAGVYTLKISDGNTSSAKRFIKQ